MEVMALVRDVNETLATIKGNVKRTSEVLAAWVANPMFDRKEGKVCCHFSLCSTLPSWLKSQGTNTANSTCIAFLLFANQPLSLCKSSSNLAKLFYCCLLVMTQGMLPFAGAQL